MANFSSLELARYLDKPSSLDKIFKVQKKGASEIVKMGKNEFEAYFHVHYLPYLKFSSYAVFQKVLKNCPYTLRNKFKMSQPEGFVADVSIRWIDPTYGFGLFAETNLAKGAYIGEYTGLVRQMHRLNPDHNAYCFHYPTRFWSLNYFIIDALIEGNELRFANHSDTPTMEPACRVDRNLLHLIFFTKREVHAGEQLNFNYGQDYWKKRKQL